MKQNFYKKTTRTNEQFKISFDRNEWWLTCCHGRSRHIGDQTLLNVDPASGVGQHDALGQSSRPARVWQNEGVSIDINLLKNN